MYQYDPTANSWGSSLDPYNGIAHTGLIAAGIDVASDTAFGFAGLGGLGGPKNDFHKYYPPVQCIPTIVPASVVNVPAQTQLTIYPNPAITELTVSNGKTIKAVIISNLLGQNIYSHEYDASQVQIDVTNLQTGIYFIKINGVEVREFIKQ